MKKQFKHTALGQFRPTRLARLSKEGNRSVKLSIRWGFCPFCLALKIWLRRDLWPGLLLPGPGQLSASCPAQSENQRSHSNADGPHVTGS